MLRQLLKELQKLVQTFNMYGVPLPMVRDPKTGRGSVSLTLVFISSILVILGLVGKWSGHMGVVDISNALEFFYASSFLYFGRNWRTGATVSEETSKTLPSKDKEDKPPQK